MSDRLPSAFRLAVLGFALSAGAAAQAPPAPSPEQGLASWYGAAFEGQVSASGETFDPRQLTAAHRTLPFGTRVLVRRLDSRQSVVVRINDRGPYIASRIIDLSAEAARLLGANESGLVPVALEVVESAPDDPRPAPATAAALAVQVGSFRNPDNARRTCEALRTKFAAGVEMRRNGELWVVLVNPPSGTEAEGLAAAIRQFDRAFQSAFVVRLASRVQAGDSSLEALPAAAPAIAGLPDR